MQVFGPFGTNFAPSGQNASREEHFSPGKFLRNFPEKFASRIFACFCDSEAISGAFESSRGEKLRAPLKRSAPTPLPPALSERWPRFRGVTAKILRIFAIYRANARDFSELARPFAFCVSHFAKAKCDETGCGLMFGARTEQRARSGPGIAGFSGFSQFSGKTPLPPGLRLKTVGSGSNSWPKTYGFGPNRSYGWILGIFKIWSSDDPKIFGSFFGLNCMHCIAIFWPKSDDFGQNPRFARVIPELSYFFEQWGYLIVHSDLG